jgi:3-hydroxyphenylacetate 6-hydroxylase
MYLIFMRMLNSFKIEQADDVDTHPVKGVVDQTQLVSVPKRYKVRFVPRDEDALRAALGTGKSES